MSSNCVIVIAGILHDWTFGHACFIAENLEKILPNFHFKRICKSCEEWKTWLQRVCKLYGWTHNKSPLIWRQIGITEIRVTYIGGNNEFWKFLHDYYNLVSDLTQKSLDALKLDLLLVHNVEEKLAMQTISVRRRRITIVGAGRSLCPDLVPQLITTQELWLSHGVEVNLYDEPGCFFKIKRIIKDMRAVGGGLKAAIAIEKLEDGLQDCEILLYLDALSREEYEGFNNWLCRNCDSMKELSKQINQWAPPHMKIIFCSTGPSCFCINILNVFLTKIPKENVVAISAHYGLEIVYNLVTSLGLSPTGFGCPPVWGFLGINQFIDVNHMIQKYDAYRPNKRALTANEKSTLPLGIRKSELRWFFYMSHDKNPYPDYLKRKGIMYYQLGRTENFQKCKAICDLLKLWYTDNKDVEDNIISLGISSNGAFGIPKGLIFSQPVFLKILEDKSKIWVPYENFPLPDMPTEIFNNLTETAVRIIEKTLQQEFKDIHPSNK